MRGKCNAFFGNFSEPCKGKHLKSTGIREDRPVPVHKFMETAHLPYHIVSRPQMQVVRIGQLNLAPDLFQIVGGHRALDGTLCTDIHKNRCLDHASVGTGKFAAPRTAFRLDDLEHRKTPLC